MVAVSPPNGGYDGVGNLRSVTDSLTGTWNYSYDNLNRLLSGTSTVGCYAGAQMSWSYDRGPQRTIFVRWSG